MGAPRLPLRLWGCSVRGARLMLLYPATLLVSVAAAHATPPNVIVAAQYEEPTTRYNHAVLGPNAEWGALKLTVDYCLDCPTQDIREHLILLPDERVFEDLAPRIADLDHDGIPEVIVIESHRDFGARLAIYDDAGFVTATPWIGTSFRWLAPLGAADLDGDGLTELAYIDRPHLAKTLRVWRFEDRSLREVASKTGLTNHKIGQAFISGGIRNCGAGPEIVTADARWRNLVATTLAGGILTSRVIGSYEGPGSFEPFLNCR